MAKKKTVLKIECCGCGLPMGEKNGGGVTGTTSGLCPECDNIARLQLAQNLVKLGRYDWPTAKRRAGVKC